jgi:cystathionine beta-lyase
VTRVEHGALVFEVEHRMPGAAGGPTLRVRRAADDRELLRFDAFAEGAHWHADPAGRDEITELPPHVDALAWTLAELREGLAAQLARVGGPAPEPGPALERTLARVEAALRNPPAELAELPEARLRERTGEKWQVHPEDVLPLWVADMDFPVAEPIRHALARAVALSDLGYPLHPRPTPLPEVFAAWVARRHGLEVDPASVEILTDVMQGVYVAIGTLTAPGDGLVVQTPIYPPFLSAVRETGRTLVENPLVEGDGGYRVDVEGLRRCAGGARAILLCNPHNPTGRAFDEAELAAIAEVALEHDLWIVSDEIHADLVYPGARHRPIADLGPEVAARTLTLQSASKAFNIAGLRCAVGVFGGAELGRRFASVPRHVRGGIGTLGIQASLAAWRHAEPWLDEALGVLEANRDHVVEVVRRELPGVRVHAPEATYLAWLDCRALRLEPSPYRFFRERAKVGLSDGAVFGKPGEGFVRLNFATSRNILDDALARMTRALRSV